MTDLTPRAGVPLLGASQAQKHVTHNEALYQFDALLCTRFLDRDLSTPPPSSADGDTYLVNATGVGAWAGQTGKIAYCADGGWRFYAPFPGLVAYVADEAALIVFNGSAWADYGSLISVQNVPRIGVNMTADSTNKLSVQSNAVLFSGLPASGGGSGDMRVTLSKQAAANTATLLFQDNFSGRAEIGLSGDDDFHFKVSPDGTTWRDALLLTASTGCVQLPGGQLKFPSLQNSSPDANTLDDYREGTWTPMITATTTPSGLAYATQSASYTKCGDVVTVVGRMTLSNRGSGGSGAISIAGLPFANGSRNTIGLVSGDFLTLASGFTSTFLSISPSDTKMTIGAAGSGVAASSVQYSGIANNTDLVFTATYKTT